MTMNTYTSEKIKNISFIAIIAVFFIHTDCKGDRDSLSFFFQDLLHTCSNFAVPLFFIISGYLFFYNKRQISEVNRGIRKRVHTLFIPYVIWCSLFIIQIWVAAQFRALNNDYFSILQNGEILRFLKRVYIAPLLAFHLWYVRDLMAVVALSPLIFICQRKKPLMFLLIIAVVCGLLKVIPWLSWPLTWFSIGSYFAFSKRELLLLQNKWLAIAMLIGYVVITVLLVHYRTYPTADKWFSFPLFLLGIIGIWNTYDVIGIHKYFHSYLTEQTFFLYCAHIPLLTVFSSILSQLVSENPLFEVIAYFLPALMTCIILVGVAQIWKHLNNKSKISRKIYSCLTGGR